MTGLVSLVACDASWDPSAGSLRSSLWDMTPRDHRQSDREFRRRQVVSAVVVVVGAVVLGVLAEHPDPRTP